MLFATPPLTPKMFEVHDRVEVLRKKLHQDTAARRWTGFLSRVMFARAIQSSNSIEGYNVTADDAIAAAEGETPLDANAETWAAISGYREALTYILQIADGPGFNYSLPLISALHYMMLQYDLPRRPGRWRIGPIYVRNSETAETVYEGPHANEVAALMEEFITSLNAHDHSPSMIRAAMGHLNLVMIHPFSDGNGRMARAVQTMILAREGILSQHFCSIEEYLGRYRSDYYAVLAEVGAGSWHPERDATAWVKFCLTAHYRQATTLLRRNKEMARLWEELEWLIEHHRLPDRTETALADAVLGFKVRNATYRRAADVNVAVASYDLSQLVKCGLLEAHGVNRGRYYVGTDQLRAIAQRIREPKPPIEDPFTELIAAPRRGQQYLPGIVWWDEDG